MIYNSHIQGDLTVDGSAYFNELSADYLDGLDSSDFLRASLDDTMYGNLTISQNLNVGLDVYAAGNMTVAGILTASLNINAA